MSSRMSTPSPVFTSFTAACRRSVNPSRLSPGINDMLATWGRDGGKDGMRRGRNGAFHGVRARPDGLGKGGYRRDKGSAKGTRHDQSKHGERGSNTPETCFSQLSHGGHTVAIAEHEQVVRYGQDDQRVSDDVEDRAHWTTRSLAQANTDGEQDRYQGAGNH